jgi:hypothetical protein
MKLSLRTWALLAWAILLIAVAIAVANKPGKLYPTFVAAGEHFRQGEPIYGSVPDGQDQYRYSPLVAASFAPWSVLPSIIGAVLWRWLQAIAFLLALRAWARVTVPHVSWPALAMLTLPLVAGNIFNAQLNPLVCALMLAGLVAFSRERFTLAAIAIEGASLFKVYPLALGLLLCVIEPRRFSLRLMLAIAIGFALPFVLQNPEYVAQQFGDWLERVGGDDRTGQELHKGYHDFQKLLRRWGIGTTLNEYRIMEVIAGVTCAGFVMWGKRTGWNRERQILVAGALGFVWCTLFGPATESATYMLLAPVSALALAIITLPPASRGEGEKLRISQIWSILERCGTISAYVLLFSVPIALWFPRPISDPYRALIPQAHAAMLLLLWIVWKGLRREARPASAKRGRWTVSPVLRRGSRAPATYPPPERVAESPPSLPRL